MAKFRLEEGDGEFLNKASPTLKALASICIKAARKSLEVLQELRRHNLLRKYPKVMV
jgi:hypothetical protein